MTASTEAVRGKVVTARRRHPKSQVCCDHRERRALCRATPQGSGANGIAPQGKVVRECPKSSRKGVLRSSRYNLASSAFGSERCRGKSPDHGTPGLPRKPRRQRSAVARGDACGTCCIDAHAKSWAECSVDSVEEKMPGVIGRGDAVGSSLRAGGMGMFGFHRVAVLECATKIIGYNVMYPVRVSFAGRCANLL